MRKLIYGLLALVFVGSSLQVAFAQQPAPSPKSGNVYTWRCGTAATCGSRVTEAFRNILDRLKRGEGNAEFNISFYCGGQVGGYAEMFANLIRGNLEFMQGNIDPDIGPEIQAAQMVYLNRSFEDADRAFDPENGWFYPVLHDLLQRKGAKLLGMDYLGLIGIGNTKRPITKPDDLKGMKIRTPKEPCRIFYERCGAETVVTPWVDAFPSLKTGLFHADSEAPWIMYLFLRDGIKYFTTTNELLEYEILTMNLNTWNSLPRELQATIQKMANEEYRKQNRKMIALNEEYLQKMKEYGIQVTDLTPEQREAFVKVARESWSYWEKQIGKEKLNFITSHIK